MAVASVHTARGYEAELGAIREALLGMAGRVEDMIGRASRALVERDAESARATIVLDREVNEAEVEIDEMCLVILAKRQPMASDLRLVTLVMKMVTDLERIADLAVNICERAIDLSRSTRVLVHEDIPKMSRAVEKMVRDAIDSFVRRDPQKAFDVLRQDDEVDDLYHSIFAETLERMRQDPRDVHELIHIQSVAKWFERMGDHSTNLAELVIFLLEGRDIRHPGRRVPGLAVDNTRAAVARRR